MHPHHQPDRVLVSPRECRALGLFAREGLLDDTLLAAVRRELESAEGELAEVRPEGERVLAPDRTVRQAWEVQLPEHLHDAVVARIDAVRPELEALCGEALDPCDSVAALRYPPGAFYRTHRDVADEPDDLGLHRRAVSVVVFVNSGGPAASGDFAGGLLRLYGLGDAALARAGVDLQPEAGTLIAFPSDLLHEVTRIERGHRYSLVTWLLARAQDHTR